MNTLRLRLLLVLGFLITFSACSAMAETIPATLTEVVVSDLQESFYSTQTGGSGTKYAYPEPFCGLHAAGASLSATYNYEDMGGCVSGTTKGCQLKKTYDSNGGVVSNFCDTSVVRSLSCPTGSTWNGADCVTQVYSCPSGYALEGTSCTRSDCVAGNKVDSGMYSDTDGDGITKRACVSGCWTNFQGTGPHLHYSFNSQVVENVYIGDYIADGTTCTVTSPTETPVTATPEQTQPIDTPEYNCATQGMTSGTVNGVVVCLPPGTPTAPAVTTQDKKVETQSDGSRTETETKDVLDGDSVTRETTITNYDAAGTQTSQTTTSTTATAGSFCEENPDSEVCAKSSLIGGVDCVEPPIAKGDAIQAAIVYQTWKTRCETVKTNLALGEGSLAASDLADVGTNAMTGEPLDKTSITEAVDVSGQISTEKFLTGGCVPDKVIALPMGQSLTIPFSSLCPHLEIIGSIMVALAMLAAARIVGVF